MGSTNVGLISQQVFDHIWRSRGAKGLIFFFITLLAASLWIGYAAAKEQQQLALHYKKDVRERWEDNPDKHPHRMAHYGYVAFRQAYPLGFFDYGLEAYLGKSVFLEAHKQNTVNFSDAGLSSGMLRFGQLSAAMILQLLMPLLLFFLGHDLIAKEKEDGTLKLLLVQGVSPQTLIWGKAIGLWWVGLLILIPGILLGLLFLFLGPLDLEVLVRYLLLAGTYALYLLLISLIAILVSARSATAKSALIYLIGCWLLFTLILPRLAQVGGQHLFPSPSKIAFDTAVEAELIRHGDSHNPDDPHFKALKDSLLNTYQVDSTHKLPFNYSGFIMKEGEKLSAETFNRHQDSLIHIFTDQQKVLRITSLINPYLALKHISMSLAGTDYAAFTQFQIDTEAFRYKLAQTLNDLQIKYISNKVSTSADKSAVIDRKFWEEMPDFEQRFPSLREVFLTEILSWLSVLVWSFLLVMAVQRSRSWFQEL
jgi:ABC-2 type transport system permease protein